MVVEVGKVPDDNDTRSKFSQTSCSPGSGAGTTVRVMHSKKRLTRLAWVTNHSVGCRSASTACCWCSTWLFSAVAAGWLVSKASVKSSTMSPWSFEKGEEKKETPEEGGMGSGKSKQKMFGVTQGLAGSFFRR